MAPLDTAAVAALLREYGQRSALRGGNPYRAKAYGRAADSLGALTEPLDRIIAQDRLKEIPGVADAIADIITKLHAHGTHPSLEAHRIAFAGQNDPEFLKIGSVFVIAAPLPLALGISLDSYVAAGRAVDSNTAALSLAAAAIVVLLGFWYVLPLWRRVRA